MLPILDEKTLDYYRLLYKDNDGYVKIRDLSKRKSLSFEASDFLSKDEIMEDISNYMGDTFEEICKEYLNPFCRACK